MLVWTCFPPSMGRSVFVSCIYEIPNTFVFKSALRSPVLQTSGSNCSLSEQRKLLSQWRGCVLGDHSNKVRPRYSVALVLIEAEPFASVAHHRAPSALGEKKSPFCLNLTAVIVTSPLFRLPWMYFSYTDVPDICLLLTSIFNFMFLKLSVILLESYINKNMSITEHLSPQALGIQSFPSGWSLYLQGVFIVGI